MTSNEHDTNSYTCICVRASRRRQWGLLHLDGFAVIHLAMAVTRWTGRVASFQYNVHLH